MGISVPAALYFDNSFLTIYTVTYLSHIKECSHFTLDAVEKCFKVSNPFFVKTWFGFGVVVWFGLI